MVERVGISTINLFNEKGAEVASFLYLDALFCLSIALNYR